MLPKTILLALASLVAFAALASNAQPAATTSGTNAPTPTKSEVLAAIAAIEKDPLSKESVSAVQTVTLFGMNSDEVLLSLSTLTAPWLDEDGKIDDAEMADFAKQVLLASYIAGSIQSQLKSGKTLDDPHAGWLFVIRAYEQLSTKIKLSFPSIERLESLESKGWLAEYAQVALKEMARDETPEIPDSKKLTRDYLSPADDLVKAGKYAEAYALYDAWLAQNANDAEAHCDLAHAMALQAYAENDKKIAADLIKKARPHALMAAALGAKNRLLPELLIITAPGFDEKQDAAYSENQKVNDLITQAEKAFRQNRYDDAAKFFQEALKYDPKSYIATLHAGDSYYASRNYPSAIEWFKKAAALDPDKETAHRYLADALRDSGKRNEALDEYITAFLTEPYSKFSRGALESAARNKNRLYKTSPIRDIPLLSTKIDPSDNTAVSLILTPADQSPMMEAYAKARIGWIKDEGKKYFSKDAGWHHNVAEESAGLRAFSAKVFELNDQKDADASNWLAAAVAIKKLDEASLLEAAIYLDRPTKDIAQDYPAYREKHRDLLERYLREFWLGQTP